MTSIPALPKLARATVAAAVVAITLVAAVACSESDADENAADAPAASATALFDSGWQRVEGIRGKRYCEVLLARIVDGRLNAEVWNTFAHSDCPQADWEALDMDAIKTERQVILALRNGPRYWLTDVIERKRDQAAAATTMFGALEMSLGATVDLGPIPPNTAPYTERVVARETVFEFSSGRSVYELVSPEGAKYVMQSYSVQSDPTLTEAELATLGARLDLPEGWAYQTRTLDDVLRIATQDIGATVLQDSLGNTYQRFE